MTTNLPMTTSVAALALSSVSIVLAGWSLGGAPEGAVPDSSARASEAPPQVRQVEQAAAVAADVPRPVPIADVARAVVPTRAEQPAAVSSGAGAERAESLGVKRLVVVRRVERREPVEGEPLRADGEPVVAFVELANDGEPRQIVVTFQPAEGGEEVGHVRLTVPGNQARWRTWARTRNVRQNGEWRAIVRTTTGEELARTDFTVG